MKKAGRKLFQALGELRDMQVMREWIERLNDRKSFSYSPGDRLSRDHLSGDPVAINRLNHVHAREAESKQFALKDLNQFDRTQWSGSGRGPCRGARVRPGAWCICIWRLKNGRLLIGTVDHRVREGSSLMSKFRIASGWCSPTSPTKVYERSNPRGPSTFISQLSFARDPTIDTRQSPATSLSTCSTPARISLRVRESPVFCISTVTAMSPVLYKVTSNYFLSKRLRPRG
jgi:hypothetical protein